MSKWEMKIYVKNNIIKPIFVFPIILGVLFLMWVRILHTDKFFIFCLQKYSYFIVV